MDLYAHTEPLRDTKAFLDGALRIYARSDGGFNVIATGIDLSAMGVKEGEAVSGYLINTINQDDVITNGFLLLFSGFGLKNYRFFFPEFFGLQLFDNGLDGNLA